MRTAASNSQGVGLSRGQPGNQDSLLMAPHLGSVMPLSRCYLSLLAAAVAFLSRIKWMDNNLGVGYLLSRVLRPTSLLPLSALESPS